jgi:hypothetical protein
MFSKSAFAVVTVIVLAASYTSVQARTHPGGGITQTKTQPRGAFAQVNPADLSPGRFPRLREQFRPPSRGCVSGSMEEGARSAFPAWDICNSDR